MGRMIDILMYCSSTKKRYKAYFEELEPNSWFGVRVEPYQERFFDKVMAALSGGGTNPSRGAMSAERQRQVSVTGDFNIGEHKCPHCGNESLVSCGTCGAWSCHKFEDNRFTCGSCGATGSIDGYIDSATGNMGDAPPHSPSSTVNNGNGTSPRRSLK